MRHLLSSGLIAGLAAGLLCALLQYFLVEPQIMLAEKYESGELTYFQPGTSVSDTTHTQGAEAAPTASAAHNHAPSASPTGFGRHALSVLFSVLIYAGYGLILAGGMAAAEMFGASIGRAEALLLGLGGFMAFQLLPALGLEPELPGSAVADLTARQLWWAATAITGVVGLGLLGYGKGWPLKLAGVAFLVLPQIIGAPQPPGFAGVVPPELAASFAARTLAVGLITWSVLGLAVQRLWQSADA